MPILQSRRSVLAGLAALGGCAPVQGGPAIGQATTLPAPVRFEEAVINAAERVMASVAVEGGRRTVVIDPLVDGVTGDQSRATQQIQARLQDLARSRYPQLSIQPFSARAVSEAPLVMVGTFTPVNAQVQTAGTREAFRFCLVMADLKSGKAVAKAVTRARLDGVDTTPTGFFQDSPAWTDDANVKSYVATCQGTQVGAPIDPTYLDGILTASIISDAIEAYSAGQYGNAADLYRNARNTLAGRQLRVFNGLYLTSWKLGRRLEAEDAFGQLVDFSLVNNRLAVKLLFRPGSTGLVEGADAPNDMWLRQIATRAAQRNTCLQVSGHTSKGGSAALNERLSLARAEFVKARLEADAPALRGRLIASGAGSNGNLVGTGADNASDALDRRVEFKIVPACT